eukprot:scaffold8422_cov82-Phaeocystis_antarctica.AAC.1
MQAGVPPCSSHRSTQWKSEVECSGGTRKQVALAGEGVQPIGQTAGAAGGRERTAVVVSRCEGCPAGAVTSFNQLPAQTQRAGGE